MPEDLRSLLVLNNTKRQAARHKIIRIHFSEGFIAEPFLDMEVNVFPRAIAWMGCDGSNNETNNHFLSLLGCANSVRCVRNEKRKRDINQDEEITVRNNGILDYAPML